MNAIHSACAAAFARHRGKTGTLHLLQEEIYRLEKNIESVSGSQRGLPVEPSITAAWIPRPGRTMSLDGCLKRLWLGKLENCSLRAAAARAGGPRDLSHLISGEGVEVARKARPSPSPASAG